jgi:hypothetical protein
MTAVALYALAGKYRALAEQLSGMDLDAQTVADTIEASGIADEIAVKAQGIEMVARTMEMHTPAIDAEIARLQALKTARQGVARGLRQYLLDNMQGMGIDKIETPFFKVSVRDNPPAVEVFEPGLVPAEFFRQPSPPPPGIDKTAIKEAIKSGREVPGCKLTRGQRLEVK